ncbi:SDR family oxidoreductase [Limimaricola cinnabarinus]|uniref:3-oxoacyl-[acyl-carrier protein] reductase n=1 Tax=Limimaricola cinnabarinus LL-001 TaxID=1337093 RepID=U2Z4Z2_9RHOB|nr:SDR family oxidoreductase [Limimaricola cinnabarinus]GAD56490.1 3-oxoacyl-[acyl-carrier protein] reductase [Limimaricola cinnabarinus LL-001]
MALNDRIISITAAGQGIGATPDPVRAEQEAVARQPMGRRAMVEDLTPSVLHLLSDDSRFITGQAAPVEGGVKI